MSCGVASVVVEATVSVGGDSLVERGTGFVTACVDVEVGEATVAGVVAVAAEPQAARTSVKRATIIQAGFLPRLPSNEGATKPILALYLPCFPIRNL